LDIDIYTRISKKHVYRTQEPPLPLYHPKGSLALSLPELDPAIFGLSGLAVNIDDHDVRSSQDAEARRLSSRARRPAAKLREIVTGEEEETHIHDTSNAANNKKAQLPDASSQTRLPSPRKRRTAGPGTAGNAGGKRRRKDGDDGDGTYPNPISRRTRNPRGAAAAVASPLGGPAVIQDAVLGEGDGEADGEDGATVAAEPMDAATARTTRPRRSRAPVAKRRGSSASETTSTSVSVSIATNARGTRTMTTQKPSEDDTSLNIEGRPASKRELADIVPEPLTPALADDTSTNRNDGELEDSSVPIATVASNTIKMDEGSYVDQGIEESGLDTGLEHVHQLVDAPMTSSLPGQSRAVIAKNESIPMAEGTAESAIAMDVDAPNEALQPPAHKEEDRPQSDSHPLKPKSPTPPAIASVPITVSATAPVTSPTATLPKEPPRQPTNTALVLSKRPQDDEKEEGELSDE
jgi:hypothetical protein